MTSPEWRTNNEPLRLRPRRVERWSPEDLRPQLSDAAQFHRDWQRLGSLHVRLGLPFSLALISVRDALRTSRILGIETTRAVTRAPLAILRPEDSAFRLDESTFAVLVGGDSACDAWLLVEQVRDLLASTRFIEEGHAVFLEVLGGVAEWSEDLASLQELVDAAVVDLERRRDGWTPGQYTDWERSD